MDILNKIVAHKKEEVAKRQELYPISLLEQSSYFETETVSMVKYLQREDEVGIIAEFKRKSPSKGIINVSASVEKVSIGYIQAGASGLSILTDNEFFGGSSNDLEEARKFNSCPILRKDFIIDDYQVIEAKSIGADVILLIARILTEMEIKRMSSLARRLGMEVLLEVHDEEDIDKASYDVDIMGVNNRNLSTFETTIETSRTLAPLIPRHFLKISESGIHDADTVIDLIAHGFEGFLVGEQFMKSGIPEAACQEFIQSIRQKQGL